MRDRSVRNAKLNRLLTPEVTEARITTVAHSARMGIEEMMMRKKTDATRLSFPEEWRSVIRPVVQARTRNLSGSS